MDEKAAKKFTKKLLKDPEIGPAFVKKYGEGATPEQI